jgi:DnaK suppressor protein
VSRAKPAAIKPKQGSRPIAGKLKSAKQSAIKKTASPSNGSVAKKPAAKKAVNGSSTNSSTKKIIAKKPPSTSSKSTKQVVAKKLSGKVTDSKSHAPKKAARQSDYSQFKSILLEKRRRLFGDVAMMSEEALGSEESAVDNHAPIHPAEVGSHSFEQEFTLGLLSRDGDKIRLVDLALEKIAEGSYGICDECGGRIPKGRLEMLPESIYCVKCASVLEGSKF